MAGDRAIAVASCASHPDFNRRSRNFTGSAPSDLAAFGSSRTVTAGAEFHRPRSTCFVFTSYNASIGRLFPLPCVKDQGRTAPICGSPGSPCFSSRIVHIPGRSTVDTIIARGRTVHVDAAPVVLFTRRELRDAGVTDRQIASEIASGSLTRVRGGLYADRQSDADVVRAARLGGRLSCASELRRLGAWVLDDQLHVHFPKSARGSPEVVRHWGRLMAAPNDGSVSVLDAVAQALNCLDRRGALAVLDSVLHLQLVSAHQLADVSLSPRARQIVALADHRAESGLETLARAIAVDLGLEVRSQVVFPGIGRVDLVVQGVVVVEADGDQFHSDPAARRRDRQRDAKLAAIGRPVLRFGYDQLVGRPDEVARALIRTASGHRAVKDPGRVERRAMKRARNQGWA